MTVTVPNRRERLRTATVAEIKEVARRQLVEGGPTAISLRAVARDMGLTAAALYRYFPSLDALVEELCADFYGELTQAVLAARDAVSADDPAGRLMAACRAFRRWSIAHPAEFTLMFGSPLPSLADFDADCHMHAAAATFAATFVETFLTVWERRRAIPAVDPDLEARIAEIACPLVDLSGNALPRPAYLVFLSGWIRLYGLLAMEVFGHLKWAATDVEPIFEAELADYLRRLTGE
jgi:AcrR family transcriptional regulator